MDDINNTDTKRMNTLLETFSLINHIAVPTHRLGHTLDLIINHSSLDLVKNITVDPDLISDHKPIFFNVDMSVKQSVYKVIGFRRHNQNFPESLNNSLSSCMNLDNIACDHSNSSCISCYVNYFRQVTSKIFDECCPYITKTIKVMDKSKKWYNSETRNAKKMLRKAENKYKKRNSIQNFNEYKRLRNMKLHINNSAKKNYIQKSITESNNDPRKIHNILNGFLGKSDNTRALPTHESKLDLSNHFRTFFIEKIQKIVDDFDNTILSSHLIPDMPLQSLCEFRPITTEVAYDLICDMKKTFCHSDPFNVKKLMMII